MINTFTDIELLGFRPPEKLTISECACKYRELSKGSAVTGLYTLELTPFFGPIMDRCCSPDIDEQYLCASVQTGKTTGLTENVSFYYTVQDPRDVVVCMADEDTADYIADVRLRSMFEDSPAANHLYKRKEFTKKFINTPNGAHIYMAWASSVSKIATKTASVVIGDEIDKPGYNLNTKEGSSLFLLGERKASFPTGYYIVILFSTPTVPGGNITMLSKFADICIDWHAKCPLCGQKQPLRFSNEYCYGFENGMYRDESGEMKKIGRIVWEGGKDATPEQIRETSKYECGECGGLWDNEMKNKAVSDGCEVPRTKPMGGERKVWNHVWKLYTRFDSGRINKIVEKFVSIYRLPKEERRGALQNFVNADLAEPFESVVKMSADTESVVLNACTNIPAQTVPEGAVALTCFVDVQKHGFWFCVRAFSNDFTSWLIHYGFLATWDDVETLLFDTIYPAQGSDKGMRIWRAGVDTGGGAKFENMSMVTETYLWLRKNANGRGCRVWGTKGASKPFPGPEICKKGRPLDKFPNGKTAPKGFFITQLDTHKLKSIYHARLKSAIDGEPGRAAYLHSGTGNDYAQQILAEELIVDEKGNEVWRQKRADNHLFDCECGCIALAEPEWQGGGVNLVRQKIINPAGRKRPGRRIISGGINGR